MKSIACCVCGIVFGVPDQYHDARCNDQRTIYCPNGDPLVLSWPKKAPEPPPKPKLVDNIVALKKDK